MVRASRALTPQEHAVVERLLSVEFPEVAYFRAQVPAIAVTGGCPCGCGSLQLTVDRALAPRAPSPAWDEGPDVIVEGDETSWLMLFQDGGYLTELEHVADHGPPPNELDAGSLVPDLQVDDDWFA